MPDRELPEDLRARLAEELTSGAPLLAPLPSQARYTTAMQLPPPRVRWRLAAAAGAAAGLVAVAAFAGPPQARAWIGQSVGNIAHTVRHPGEGNPPPQASPFNESPAASPGEHRTPESSPSQEPRESPEPSESPESSASPEPRESPEPEDSPRPSATPAAATPRPSPRPSGD
jgi:hypothetical protein